MNPSDPARPVQYQLIKRKAIDAGLTSHELDMLCHHVVNCEYRTLTVNDATEVLAWLVSVGWEHAKWRIHEMNGQRHFV